ncbi:uncharacterized protein LOC144539602 [Centroberyx gerrardi]
MCDDESDDEEDDNKGAVLKMAASAPPTSQAPPQPSTVYPSLQTVGGSELKEKEDNDAYNNLLKTALIQGLHPTLKNQTMTTCIAWETKPLSEVWAHVLHAERNQTDIEQRHTDKDSLPAQARHYKTLQEMYKKQKPNQDAVSQLLDLEFDARRTFIDSDALKEEDRPTKILDAYPCFKDLNNVMDELRRILDKGNRKYIAEVKKRWEDFCSKVQFYRVWKKVMKPPMTLDGVEFAIALFRALPILFPSPAALPKKVGHASEALLHVFQPTEDPNVYLQKRSLFSPVLLLDGSNCLVTIGTTPITTFAKEDLYEGLLYLMAYYYTLHLTYPKCVATLLSVI